MVINHGICESSVLVAHKLKTTSCALAAIAISATNSKEDVASRGRWALLFNDLDGIGCDTSVARLIHVVICHRDCQVIVCDRHGLSSEGWGAFLPLIITFSRMLVPASPKSAGDVFDASHTRVEIAHIVSGNSVRARRQVYLHVLPDRA